MSLTAALDSARASLMASGIQSSTNLAQHRRRQRCRLFAQDRGAGQSSRGRRLRAAIPARRELRSLQQRLDRDVCVRQAGCDPERSSDDIRLDRGRSRNRTVADRPAQQAEAGAQQYAYAPDNTTLAQAASPPPRTWRRRSTRLPRPCRRCARARTPTWRPRSRISISCSPVRQGQHRDREGNDHR